MVAPASSVNHWPYFVPAIAVPVGALVVLTLFECSSIKPTLRELAVKLGWDLCVLSFGMTGAAVGLPKDDVSVPAVWRESSGIVAIIVVLLMPALILIIRSRAMTTNGKEFAIAPFWALVAFALGWMAIAVPWYLTFHR